MCTGAPGGIDGGREGAFPKLVFKTGVSIRWTGLGGSMAGGGWALSAASNVLLMIVHSAEKPKISILSKQTLRIRTLLEESFQGNRFIVYVAANKIVDLCIVDHGSEIALERKSILIHPFLQLRAHRAEIHRILDDVKIAENRVKQWSRRKTRKSYFGA